MLSKSTRLLYGSTASYRSIQCSMYQYVNAMSKSLLPRCASLSVSHDEPGAKITEKNGPRSLYFEEDPGLLFQDW